MFVFDNSAEIDQIKKHIECNNNNIDCFGVLLVWWNFSDVCLSLFLNVWWLHCIFRQRSLRLWLRHHQPVKPRRALWLLQALSRRQTRQSRCRIWTVSRPSWTASRSCCRRRPSRGLWPLATWARSNQPLPSRRLVTVFLWTYTLKQRVCLIWLDCFEANLRSVLKPARDGHNVHPRCANKGLKSIAFFKGNQPQITELHLSPATQRRPCLSPSQADQ